MKYGTKFEVGDKVISKAFGVGTVSDIVSPDNTYTITVKWDDDSVTNGNFSYFTSNGHFYRNRSDTEKDIELLERGEKKVEDNTEEGLKEEPKEEKAMTEEREFKVGDRVWSFHFGVGIVDSVSGDNMQYPIAVKWTDNSKAPNTCDYFTKDGEFDCENPSMKDIAPLEIIDHAKDEEGTGVVDRMMDALDKKTDEAVNPKHYHVEGIPEAIYLMTHLMNKEQLEGFLWGNIVKYAYRYGRKGDKAETAGKIAWYAKRLEEVLKGEHNET